MKTQNSGVLVPGVDNKNLYGQLEEVIVMSYFAGCSVVLFKCKWFDTDLTNSRMKHENNITSIFTKFEWYKDDKFILATQAKQIFYLDDLKNDRDWKIVEEVHHRNVWDTPAADEQLDPIEIDVMHDTISSDFQLFVDLGPLPEINFCRRDQSPYVVNVDTPVDQEEDEEEEEEEMVDEEEEEMVDEKEEEEMDLEEDNVEENENDSDNEYYSDD